jgi:hypothetical protein
MQGLTCRVASSVAALLQLCCMQWLTCRIASSPCHSLPTSLLSPLLPELVYAGRCILSTTSLTLLHVLLSMIVLPAAQVLDQSSAGTASRAAAKASAANSACSSASNAGCVSVAYLVVRVLFFCAAGCLPFSVSPFPAACLAAHISLRRIDSLGVRPDECSSFSAAVVSRLVTALPSSGCLPVYWPACLPQALSPDILRCASEGCLRLLVLVAYACSFPPSLLPLSSLLSLLSFSLSPLHLVQTCNVVSRNTDTFPATIPPPRFPP